MLLYNLVNQVGTYSILIHHVLIGPGGHHWPQHGLVVTYADWEFHGLDTASYYSYLGHISEILGCSLLTINWDNNFFLTDTSIERTQELCVDNI